MNQLQTLPSLVQLGRDLGLSQNQCDVLEQHEQLTNTLLGLKESEASSIGTKYREEKSKNIQLQTMLKENTEEVKRLHEQTKMFERQNKQLMEQFEQQKQTIAAEMNRTKTLEGELEALQKQLEEERERRMEAENSIKEIRHAHSDNFSAIQNNVKEAKQQLDDLRATTQRERNEQLRYSVHMCERTEERMRAAQREEERRKEEEKSLLQMKTQLTEEKERRRVVEEERNDLNDQLRILSEHTNVRVYVYVCLICTDVLNFTLFSFI
eukprot:m.93401 g.93401  ORF g.93401 m.93401 type:complete len:267 (-) comp12383_c1_seq3:1343-2143(-)